MACARAFAAEGARVAVHYHRGEQRAREVAAELGGAPVLRADLQDEVEVDRLFAAAREALGRVEVCAAVAGVWPREDTPVWELSLERWEATLRGNLTATFLTARAFLREVAYSFLDRSHCLVGVLETVRHVADCRARVAHEIGERGNAALFEYFEGGGRIGHGGAGCHDASAESSRSRFVDHTSQTGWLPFAY